MTLKDKILAVLRFVPIPYVREAAEAVTAVIAIVQGANDDAVKNSTIPPTLDEWHAAVHEATAEAAEPWRRIRDRAQGEIVKGDSGD